MFSTKTFELEFVAGAPGPFTLTSRIVHSGVSDTDGLEVLPLPLPGRTVALVDEGSCTHGRPLSARMPGASAFTQPAPVGRFPWDRASNGPAIGVRSSTGRAADGCTMPS